MGETQCFICGIEKRDWLSSPNQLKADIKKHVDFEYHCKTEHYMWNYIFYQAYLEEKNPLEYNGIESYISDCRKIGNLKLKWYPFDQALSYNDGHDEFAQK